MKQPVQPKIYALLEQIHQRISGELSCYVELHMQKLFALEQGVHALIPKLEKPEEVQNWHGINLAGLKELFPDLSLTDTVFLPDEELRAMLRQFTDREGTRIDLEYEQAEKPGTHTTQVKVAGLLAFLLEQYQAFIIHQLEGHYAEILSRASTLLEVENKRLENAHKEADVAVRKQDEAKPCTMPFVTQDVWEQWILSYGMQHQKMNLARMKKMVWVTKPQFKELQEVQLKWHTTFYAFYEDWRFKEQLFILVSHVQRSVKEAMQQYNARIEQGILPINKANTKYIEQFQELIPEMDALNKEQLRSFLSKELYKLKKSDGNATQPEKLEAAARAVLGHFNAFEADISEFLEALPARIGVVKNPNYLAGIRKNEIRYFSPKELIEFKILPAFFKTHNESKLKIQVVLNSIIAELKDFDQIVDYFLDMALAHAHDAESNEALIPQMVNEGLSRTLNLSKRIAELCDRLSSDYLLAVSSNYNDLIHKLKALDDNNNTLGIYADILRARAISETQKKKAFLKETFQRSYRAIRSFISTHFAWLNTYYSDIRERLNLGAKEQNISSDLSNYLVEARQKIARLPLVYQHLFEDAPVKEFNLFLHRKMEMEVIDGAYNDWIKGKYGATLITDENGSGKSSMLLYYQEKTSSNHGFVFYRINDFTYSNSDFFPLINNLLGTEGLDSDEALHGYIEELSVRKVIILDGLERLFIKSIGGFDCIQKLLSFIVSTNHKFFWVCSISHYAETYLSKTIAFNDYFDYRIRFHTLSTDAIKSIVLKRHRISGFNLEFVPGENTPERLKPDEKYLFEGQYFEALNRFAQGNISLALVYWLESVSDIENDTVYISPFEVPEFRFFDNLSKEKVYTLVQIVTHGKISATVLAVVLSQPIEISRRILTVMKEDAILYHQDGYYFLNRMLYRHAVKFLLTRNLIH